MNRHHAAVAIVEAVGRTLPSRHAVTITPEGCGVCARPGLQGPGCTAGRGLSWNIAAEPRHVSSAAKVGCYGSRSSHRPHMLPPLMATSADGNGPRELQLPNVSARQMVAARPSRTCASRFLPSHCSTCARAADSGATALRHCARFTPGAVPNPRIRGVAPRPPAPPRQHEVERSFRRALVRRDELTAAGGAAVVRARRGAECAGPRHRAVRGPVLGRHESRGDALEAEKRWLAVTHFDDSPASGGTPAATCVAMPCGSSWKICTTVPLVKA